MTWEQWVNSEYNTIGMSTASGFVYLYNTKICYDNTVPCSPDETINEDLYYAMGGGSDN